MTTKIRRMRFRGTATETRTNLTQQPTYDDARNRRRGNRPIRQSLLGVGVPRSCAIPTTRGVGSTRGTRSADRRARSTRTSMDATINREKMRISISSINILRHLVPPAWAFDQGVPRSRWASHRAVAHMGSNLPCEQLLHPPSESGNGHVLARAQIGRHEGRVDKRVRDCMHQTFGPKEEVAPGAEAPGAEVKQNSNKHPKVTGLSIVHCGCDCDYYYTIMPLSCVHRLKETVHCFPISRWSREVRPTKSSPSETTWTSNSTTTPSSSSWPNARSSKNSWSGPTSR